MESKKERKEKNFPLLRPDFQDEKEVKILDPLFLGEKRRLENFINLVLSPRSLNQKKRVLVRVLREILGAKGTTSEIYNEFCESLEEAHQFVRWIYQTYLPVRFFGIVNSDGLIAEETDFISLLKKYQGLGNDRLSRIREFEARRAILLTIILFDLKIHRERLQLNGALIQDVMSYLEKRFFVPGTVRKTLISFHDPENFFRVAFWCFPDEKQNMEMPKELTVRETELDCRKFEWKGKEYLIYFAFRDKTRFSHLCKMFRKDIRDPHASALDWRGFKLVFFSQDALEAGIEKLREQVFYFPGVTWKLEDGRFFRESENPYSSRNFRAKKFITIHKGQPCEVIIETIENHLNGLLSLGDENHELYRVRQLISTALPLIFPKELYQVDWKDSHVQEEIIEVVKGRLK